MGSMSREKGKRGEREVAAIISDLLGVSASCRVRQHEGDSDILGVPGWSIEVKRWSLLHTHELNRAWAQAVAQAQSDGGIPARRCAQVTHGTRSSPQRLLEQWEDKPDTVGGRS